MRMTPSAVCADMQPVPAGVQLPGHRGGRPGWERRQVHVVRPSRCPPAAPCLEKGLFSRYMLSVRLMPACMPVASGCRYAHDAALRTSPSSHDAAHSPKETCVCSCLCW